MNATQAAVNKSPMRRLTGFVRATYAWVNKAFNIVAKSRFGGFLAVVFSFLFLALDFAVLVSFRLPLVNELTVVLFFSTLAIIIKSWIPKLKALLNAPSMSWEEQKSYAASRFYDCYFGWTWTIIFLFVILMFRPANMIQANDKLLTLFMLISFQRLWALKTRFTDPLEVITITWAEWDRLVEAHQAGRERIREIAAAAQPLVVMATKANDVPPVLPAAKPVVKTTITAPASAPVVLSTKAAAFVDEAKDEGDEFAEDEAGETKDVVTEKPAAIVAKYYPPAPATISPPPPPVQQVAPPPAVTVQPSTPMKSSSAATVAKLIESACIPQKGDMRRAEARTAIMKVITSDKDRLITWLTAALTEAKVDEKSYMTNLKKLSEAEGKAVSDITGGLIGHVYATKPQVAMKQLTEWLESEMVTA